MANITKCISNIIPNIAIDSIRKQPMINGMSRTLYTDRVLHLDKYIRSRKIVQRMFRKSDPELFKMKMAKLVADETSVINVNDISATCSIIDKRSEDINLLNNIVYKVSESSNSIDTDQLKQVGVDIMLTLHYVGKAELALKMFMNPKYHDIFSGSLVQLILLDLLFESRKYCKVRQVYDEMSRSTPLHNSFTRSLSPLVAISCYKENTSESLEYALKLYETLLEKNILLPKVIAACGALALNQKAPEVALKLMQSHSVKHAVHTCIEIMALADLDRLNQVEERLELIVNSSNLEIHYLSEEIVPKIKSAIKRAGVDNTSKLSRLLDDVINNGYVQKSIFNNYFLSPIKKDQVSFGLVKKADTKNIQKHSKTS